MPVETAIQELSKPALDDPEKEALLKVAEGIGRERAFEETRAFIAHELRHAVTPLSTYANLISEALSRPDFNKEELDKYSRRLMTLSRAAGQVVERYLDYTQPLYPQLHVEDLQQLLTAVIARLRAEGAPRGIEISERVSATEPVLIDRAMIAEVLLQVWLNAVEAMPEGGRLTVTLEQKERRAVITISDTGVGIKPEHLPRVFDLDFSTKSGQRGAGVGLALSRRVIEEAHGGRIGIANNPDGAGVTVTIELPTAREESTNGR
jgi:two-component system sensor histidine kinase HydH